MLPSLIVIGLLGYFSYKASQWALNKELEARLIAVAEAVSSILPGERLALLKPEDEMGRTHRNNLNKIELLANKTSVSRIFVFDKNLKIILDSSKIIGLGQDMPRLKFDIFEIESSLKGKSSASALFVGKDGRFYKTGYAPLMNNTKAIGVIGVDGSADFVSTLDTMRQIFIITGIASILMIGIISFILSRGLVNPIYRLVDFAKGIGKGDFETNVRIESNDEIGFLSQTLEHMRVNVQSRDQRLQMMLSGIAHEIRNPLGGMELFLGLLKEDLINDPERGEMVHKSLGELNYLKNVVNDFLDFARDKPLNLSVVDNGFLIEIIFLLSGEFEKKGVELKTDLNRVKEVYCDSQVLRRAIINLLQNALQATKTGGIVEILAENQNGKTLLRIKDTGCGIPKEKIESVFTPFYTTKEKGSGLGLAFVKKIINQHNGSISVDSVKDAGTVFNIYLPDE